MPKRFTDTEKWRDDWWGSLPNDYRMIWLYLVDSCSIAGIWKKDFRGLNFNCNTNITETEFMEAFGSRVIDKGNFYFIPKFVLFQNPRGLNSNKPAVVSIVKELEANGLIPIIHESFGNGFLTIKGKGIGKGREREQEGKRYMNGVEMITDKEAAWQELTADPVLMEDAKVTITQNGWRSYDEDDIRGIMRTFIAKQELPTPRDELRRYWRNWLFREPKEKLMEYGRNFKNK